MDCQLVGCPRSHISARSLQTLEEEGARQWLLWHGLPHLLICVRVVLLPLGEQAEAVHGARRLRAAG
jgi:hypothetical protein